MSDRISRALRELADALDDEAWEVTRPATGVDTQARELLQVVRGRLERPPHGTSTSRRASTSVENPRETASGPGGTPSSPFPSGPTVASSSSEVEAAGARDTTGSSVAYHQDSRIYVILSNPKKPWMVGVISGPSPETWLLIERNLPGGRLSGSSARLRRVPSLQVAAELWERHHPGMQLPQLRL